VNKPPTHDRQCASRCGFLLALAPLSPVVHATENPAQPAFGSAPDLLSVAGSLFVVVAVIVALALLVARVNRLRASSGDVVTVVASQALGPKERLLVVEVADKQLLLGMTSNSVATLHVFDEPIIQKSEAVISFSSRLKAALRPAK